MFSSGSPSPQSRPCNKTWTRLRRRRVDRPGRTPARPPSGNPEGAELQPAPPPVGLVEEDRLVEARDVDSMPRRRRPVLEPHVEASRCDGPALGDAVARASERGGGGGMVEPREAGGGQRRG